MRRNVCDGAITLSGLVLLAVAVAVWPAQPQAAAAADDRIPAFEFDPTWPKTPLPNHWILGVIGGVHVDDKDNIWVAHRGNTAGLDAGDDHLARGVGDCCRSAPSIVVFDQAGRITKAWGGPDPKRPGKTVDGYDWPREHGIFVDRAGNVWLGCEGGAFDKVTGPDNCGSVTKLAPDGRILWQKGKTGQTKGNADIENFNSPTGIVVDEAAREAFISDGYRNQRIAVIDADTGAFKRMWGPYGEKPQDIPRNKLNGGTSGKHEPEGMKTFGDSVHCIEMSRDGLVYVCDRGNNRIHVYKKDGTFVQEGFVAPKTGAMGAVFDIAFSSDPQQRFMYVADGANHHVHIVRREDLAVLGHFGNGGRYAGELGVAHVIASDSRGNVYVGETSGRNRIMRFKYVGMRKRPPQAQAAPAPPQSAATAATTPAIPGVVAAGTPIELVQEGFVFTEGPVGTSDGGLLFTDTQSKPPRIHRLDPGGAVRPLAETQGVNGLAIDTAGTVFGAEMFAKRIVRLDAQGNVAGTVTMGTADRHLVQPNDLIADARGGIYFTDPGTFDPKSTATTHVYYLDPGGALHVVTDQIALPNGLTLTPDGRILLVADTRGDEISAFDIRADGTTGPRRVFARLVGIPAGQGSAADGMTVDREGRVYATSRTGIQVLSKNGRHLGTIVPPRPAANVAFSGPGKQYLYIAARQGLYRLKMLSRGVARPGK